jgi:aspartate kinase
MSGVGREITTLGRGGSDTTAVALAAALRADVCEIYTDVNGIYSADPRIVPDARHLDKVCYEEMLELAACGAKVVALRAVEYARRYHVPLRVRSSYNDKPGSLIAGSMEDIPVEHAIITGVAHDRSEGKVTVTGVPDTPGYAARIFRAVAEAEIDIDMVLQNISHASGRGAGGASIGSDRRTDITFTLPRSDGQTAVDTLERVKEEIGFDEVFYDGNVGKVSLVGAGMRSHPGVTATFCESLSRAGINIETMNTSEIRISVLCREDQLDDAVRALHTAFELGGDEQVVVYAGSGR